MPSFITPARLTALAGVLTGLAAAVTAALGVVPHDGQVYLVGQEVAGLLTTGVSVAKFLEGQAGWEQLQSAQKHAVNLSALQHSNTLAVQKQQHANLAGLIDGVPAQTAPEPSEPEAELPDEVPLNTIDQSGEVINEVDPATGEPLRLAR